jgi:hypothetical protein
VGRELPLGIFGINLVHALIVRQAAKPLVEQASGLCCAGAELVAKLAFCHPERSEGSQVLEKSEILRCVQNDIFC